MSLLERYVGQDSKGKELGTLISDGKERLVSSKALRQT